MRQLLLFVVLISVTLFSCSEDDVALDLSGTVKYEVTSNPGGFDITYENSGGGTEQETVSSTTWTKTFTGKQGDFVYVSAQADNEAATITAKIYYKGQVIETATSSGDFVIATASGSIP